ncbi:MAG: bacillithiol biosynthesis deacetylase BshB1 [Candidatus Schekmanbacteria bacterium]|nr:bacillithiol biosynthesis deacetylase BshB1 [Candidatus Schekmanbacteria bacterium]
MKIDFLVIGAHPDDAEIGAGGLLLKMKHKGYRTGIIDLTKGEMGTRGNVEMRMKESEDAAKILNLDVRRNLDLGDGHLELNIHNRHILAKTIRELKPTFIIAPYFNDKHPDHMAAGQLAKCAYYDARIGKIDLGWPAHSAAKIFYYFSHLFYPASFIIDITPYFAAKIAAVRAHDSQFGTAAQELKKPYLHLGISDYILHIEARSCHFGSLINTQYAEGFLCEDILAVDDPYMFLSDAAKVFFR